MFTYKIQRGVLPYTFLIIGMVTILYSGIVLVLLLAKPIFLGVLELPRDFPHKILFYLSAIPLFLVGFYLTFIFPRIMLSHDGLKYRGVLFIGKVLWDEIDDLYELRNGVILLSIKRKGSFLFNGLLFQCFTGILLRQELPVLLLAPGLDQRDLLLKEIISNSSANEVRKVTNSYS